MGAPASSSCCLTSLPGWTVPWLMSHNQPSPLKSHWSGSFMTVTGKETKAQLPRTLSETGSLCCSGQHCRARLALRSFYGVACLLPILLQELWNYRRGLPRLAVSRSGIYVGSRGSQWGPLACAASTSPLSHLPSPQLNFSSISFGLWFAIIRKIIKLSYMMLSSAF